MKKLLELVSLVTPNKTKSITIIGNGKGGSTKLDKLYRLIASGEVVNDEEAYLILYPEQTSKNSFYKLKHELRERLHNTAFFIDAKKNRLSLQEEAYLRCQWLTNLGGILHAAKARSNMVHVAKAALETATKFEFTNEAISAIRRLLNVAKLRADEREVDRLSDLYLDLVQLQQKEAAAEVYWTKIGVLYAKSKSFKKDVSQKAKEFRLQLDGFPSRLKSVKLYYFQTMISAAEKMATNNFLEAIPILRNGLTTIEGNEKFVSNSFTYGVAINLLACYIPLKRYDEAREVLVSLYKHTKEGTYNWYKSRELHFILAMHTANYEEANRLHADTISQKTFKRQQPFIREAWTIYGAYLRILINAGKVKGEENASPFRISRYLNQLPTFSKDKRGQNVPVLISQIVLLLQQGNFDGLIDRYEAVNKYRERYVEREVNFRGNVFLHMLRQMTTHDFDRCKVEKETVTLRNLLDQEPVDVMSPGYDQEILPYEELWEVLVETMD
jgi:hypothetical protein